MDRIGGEAVVEVLPIADPASSQGATTLQRVQAAAGPAVHVGGAVAANDDFVAAVYGSFPETNSLPWRQHTEPRAPTSDAAMARPLYTQAVQTETRFVLLGAPHPVTLVG